MPLHPPNLILEDLVIEAGLELPLPAARLGDVHGGLPAAQHDERFLRREGGRVEGGFGGVLFQGREVAGGEELGEFVLGGGDEVGSVGGHLDVLDLHVGLVGLEVVEELARLIRGFLLIWLFFGRGHGRVWEILLNSGETGMTNLGIILRDAAVLMTGDDVFGQVTPGGNGGLALVAGDGQSSLVRLLGIHVRDDVKDHDGAQEAHPFLGHRE